jgi:type IV pilus assembly protein PilM
LMGLDIGSSAVKAIELKPTGKGYRVTAIGVEPIPPDSIVDGAIIDGGAVADAVRRLFANAQFKARDVAASLSGNSVIVKKITLPAMTEQELSDSISTTRSWRATAAHPRAPWTSSSWRRRRTKLVITRM